MCVYHACLSHRWSRALSHKYRSMRQFKLCQCDVYLTGGHALALSARHAAHHLAAHPRVGTHLQPQQPQHGVNCHVVDRVLWGKHSSYIKLTKMADHRPSADQVHPAELCRSSASSRRCRRSYRQCKTINALSETEIEPGISTLHMARN